jgi:hypothetical protein
MNLMKLIFKFLPFRVTLVRLAWLMKESRHVHWRDSWGRRVPGHRRGATSASVMPYDLTQLSRADWCGVTDAPSHRTAMESRHVSRRDSWRSRANRPSATTGLNRVVPPSLSSSSISFFLPSLFTGCSIGDFEFSPNRSPWCEKSTLWAGILIVLGTYVVFTILFCCILNFLFGWTHVVGIRDEINVFVISM